MAQPVHYWVPSIAPSGMAFYDGAAFPEWQDDLFVGGLRAELLVRLELEGEQVVGEERLLEGAIGRIRDVRSAPTAISTCSPTLATAASTASSRPKAPPRAEP